MLGVRLLPIVLAAATTASVLAQHAPALVGEGETPTAEPIEPATEEGRQTRRRRGGPILRIGDTAPPLAIAEIVSGPSDVGRLDPGRVVVVEFWATWCGPCVAGMPALDELARRHADDGVSVLAVTREEPDVVERFLEDLDADRRPTFAIGVDDEGRSTAAYMNASRRQGIPCVFVVDRRGRIAWFGHPTDLRTPLERIVAGTWDLEAARRDHARSERARQMMAALAVEIESADSDEDLRAIVGSIDEAIARGDGHPELELEQFRILLGPLEDPRGFDVGWRIKRDHPNDAWLLARLAEVAMDDGSIPDPAFVLEVAKAADRAAAGSDPWILATLSRAYRRSGDDRSADRFADRALGRISADERDRLVLVLERD